jgi:hypothetical protein
MPRAEAVKFALVAAAGITTAPGTVRAEIRLLFKATVAPPAGAA